MPSPFRFLLAVAAMALLAGICVAQPYMPGYNPSLGGGIGGGRRGGRGGRGGGFGGGRGGGGLDSGPWVRTEGGDEVNEDTVTTARETAGHSVDLPEWKNPPQFDKDVFTFARIIFKSTVGGIFIWVNDYPDEDLNLSARLRLLTSLKANPDGRVLKLTNPALTDYPVLFGTQPGYMILRDEEVVALRKYLRAGGALVVDDFWGTAEWNNFAAQMKRVLPERAWTELPPTHPLFHCIFDLKVATNHLQVPTINFWNREYDPADPNSRPTYRNEAGSETMHVRALLDDKLRIMVLALHNTDDGDGMEREGENPDYFKQFSEKRAYPLYINIIYYLMTH